MSFSPGELKLLGAPPPAPPAQRPLIEQEIAILADLRFGHSSAHELAQMLGIHKTNALVHLRKLRAAGRVRIAGWTRERRGNVPLYALGSAPDAPRPTPKTNAQRSRAKRERQREQASRAIAPELEAII